MVRILGWLVIAHGLFHAVLPMRGSLAPWLHGDWMPIALYAVSTTGFVAAGLGLLGLRPFDRLISPLLVLSSAWSVIAMFVFGDPRLWLGAAADAMLFLTGLWRGFAGWPSHPTHGRIWHVAAVTSGFVLVGYVGLAAFTHPTQRTWGSTRAELAVALPGDAEPRDRALEVQHAITIDAPAEDVWEMLVQRVSGTIFTPERVLVVDSQGTFVLLPDDERTRLFVRSTISTRDMPIWEAAAGLFGYEVRDFIAQRALMLSVKASAEERWAVRALEEPARTVDIGGTDDMKYSVTAISAVPGERLRIRLTSRGVIPKVAMAHNVVVVHLDTDIDTMLKEGAPYRDNDFIPPSMQKQVIAKTGFAGPGETVQVTFTVPEEPGAYPFLCTFSGHYQAGMKGTLTVERKKTTN